MQRAVPPLLIAGILLASSPRFTGSAWASAPQDAPQGSAAQSYDTVDRFQTALRALREGVLAGNEGVQHAALVALRQLRDPALSALFERLADGDDWSARVDSVLGLAELSPGARIDIDRIERLPGERDREAAINATLSLRLADREQIEAMLAWSDLPSSQRALLAAELRRLGGTPETAMVVRLANSKTPEIAGLATCILLDMKAREAAPLAGKVRDQIAALPPATRSAAIAQVADACAANRLAGAGPFLASLLALPDLAEEARMRALGNLLIFAPADGYQPLQAALTADSSQSSLFRYASILLASGAPAPAEVWARFRNGDSMLEAIADAGTAIGAGSRAAAYRALIGLERRVILRAAIDGANRIGEDAERDLGQACLEFVLRPGPTPPQMSETLLAALFRLAELEPGQFRAALATPDLDSPTKDALLMALLHGGSTAAAEVAVTARGGASRLGEGQIAVLTARHAGELAPKERDALLGELLLVAGGAVNVSLPVRIQAAWLWMKLAGKSDDALAALVPADSAGNAAKDLSRDSDPSKDSPKDPTQ
jgi:hypothetical protein